MESQKTTLLVELFKSQLYLTLLTVFSHTHSVKSVILPPTVEEGWLREPQLVQGPTTKSDEMGIEPEEFNIIYHILKDKKYIFWCKIHPDTSCFPRLHLLLSCGCDKAPWPRWPRERKLCLSLQFYHPSWWGSVAVGRCSCWKSSELTSKTTSKE